MDNSKEMRTLRMINTLFGYATIGLNVCYDDEAADFFDAILTSKISEVGEVIREYIGKELEDAPQEMKDLTVCELLEQMNAEIFG